MKILIIKLGAAGDVLRTTSILQGLKEKYPNSSIYWVTKKSTIDLLKNNHYINKIYTIDEKDSLLNKEFDKIINLDEDIEACKLASSLKGEIVGFYLGNNEIKPTKTAQVWFNMGILGKKPINNILKKQNKATYQQHMFDIIGIKPTKYDTILNLTEKELNFAENFANKNNIKKQDLVIGINTGAGSRWQLKSWSIEKTAELIDKLNGSFDCKIILFGGPEEIERNKEILNKAKTSVIDAGCNNSLLEFASLVNLTDILITSDSLAMHIGIALKKKLVVLFGPTSAAEIELYNRGKKIIPDMECVCCYKKTCDIKPNCMDKITVDEVFSAVNELINNNKKQK